MSKIKEVYGVKRKITHVDDVDGICLFPFFFISYFFIIIIFQLVFFSLFLEITQPNKRKIQFFFVCLNIADVKI